MDHESYSMLGRPHRIQNDISNSKIAFGDMSRYRLYRRAGGETRFETAGNYLALRNLALLVFRGRWGGRVVDASAFAKITDAQS
jgi:HK97 family phage major capsid protein